jgi:hypothetical protein
MGRKSAIAGIPIKVYISISSFRYTKVQISLLFSLNLYFVFICRLLVGCNQHRLRYQLVFLNGIKTAYTMSKLESGEGTAIKVAIVETLGNNQTRIVRSGHLSSAKVEVLVLHGHFNAKEESWGAEHFSQHIVSGREKSAQLLTGNLTLRLNGGEAFLENATFTDNSSFTSTKMFRLGLRLLNASGERVLEGVTEPFRVKERRVEGIPIC